jgi:hypothetical protein
MNPAAAATLPTNVRRDRRVEESFSSFIVIAPNSGAWFRHGVAKVIRQILLASDPFWAAKVRRDAFSGPGPD